jgi:D-glycero-D-manno-heptose 1,7-bisphosphate phosphatase
MKKSSSKSELRPAVFLDRDGVVIEDLDYAVEPNDCHILPGAIEAMIELRAKNFLVIIVSNQSGIARGFFTEARLAEFNHHMFQELAPAIVDGLFYCPHHPEGKVAKYSIDCDCRKPKTGLIDQACAKFPIDLGRSFLVGDKWSDVECAVRARIKGLQVLSTGKTAERHHDQAFALVPSLKEAATIILKAV